jgi:antitoxin YefM
MSTTHTTYSDARAHFATLYDRAVDDREIIYIKRRGKEDLALIAASELDSLLETAHLLRSPANARRLFSALQRALNHTQSPSTLEALRADMNLTEDETE